ncbi:hypothetical protein J5X84_18855 [Streptosporangiaceae bacterium NEAU-GS5]|nr:hypothetical protein [Streptosporangiaceae bacterium NEAU-GS5]
MAKERDPLQPIASAAYMLFWFPAILIGLALAATILHKGDLSYFGLNRPICVDGQASRPGIDVTFPGARPGTYGVTLQRVCDESLDAGQTFWVLIGRIPGFVLTMGAFFLLWRLTVHAAKDGIYASPVAGRVRFLGWWLTAGAVIAPVAESFANFRRDGTLVDEPTWQGPDISLPILLTGLGLITFARIMRIGVRMSQDLEGTV